MQREHTHPWWLMNGTMAMLSVLTNTCFLLICQCIWGVSNELENAWSLHTLHQPSLEASVMTTTCLDAFSKGVSPGAKRSVTHGSDVHSLCDGKPCSSWDSAEQPVLQWSRLKQCEPCNCHLPNLKVVVLLLN